jgi:RNA polymerase primary sigma factor
MDCLSHGVVMSQAADPKTAEEDAQLEEAESLLGKLTRREERILRMRFGIGTEPRQVSDIGKGLGIATATVQRIQWRALQRLRLHAIQDA